MSKANLKAEDSKVTSTEPLNSSEAKWTKLVKVNYTDPQGRSRVWESAERTTRPKDALIDGVGVIAIIKYPNDPHILLQKQFRPPIGKVCIEIPAGLLDAGETAEECAVRELKEETGYVGKAVKVGGEGMKGKAGEAVGVMFNDPGFTNTNLQLIHVDVDPELPENKDGALEPELEDGEFIETFKVPLKDLWNEFRKLEAEGYAIDARVGTIAEGLRLAAIWNVTA